VLALGAAAAGASSVGSVAPGSGGVAPVAPASPAPASARTPYMGWNTYYGVGGRYDEHTILSVARALIRRGLAAAGYRIVWLDWGWADGQRSPAGQIVVNRHQWPHGMAWLASWLHDHGLFAGIYTDAGRSGCRHDGLGSYGHYQQDADSFAAWGFDAVKVDFCGAGQEGLDPRPLYASFARAIHDNASHRPMLLNVCNFWVPGQINGTSPSLANSSYENATWARSYAASWRTDTDIGRTGAIKFVNVVRNLGADARDPNAARPGHWNDPDYLGPQLGMTSSEAAAQVAMWAIVAAPLVIGSDPRLLSRASLQMLENPTVIAIDQDPLGIQGTELATVGTVQIWARHLVGGALAVALLNTGSAPVSVSTTALAVGLDPSRLYTVQDAWSGDTTLTHGALAATVAPESAILWRITPDA
jgi:alpha-galactosidase